MECGLRRALFDPELLAGQAANRAGTEEEKPMRIVRARRKCQLMPLE